MNKIYLCPKENCRVLEEQCEKCMLKSTCKRQEIAPSEPQSASSAEPER